MKNKRNAGFFGFVFYFVFKTEVTVNFVNLSFVTWHVIIAAIRTWVHRGHKVMDMVNNDTQVAMVFK